MQSLKWAKDRDISCRGSGSKRYLRAVRLTRKNAETAQLRGGEKAADRLKLLTPLPRIFMTTFTTRMVQGWLPDRNRTLTKKPSVSVRRGVMSRPSSDIKAARRNRNARSPNASATSGGCRSEK